MRKEFSPYPPNSLATVVIPSLKPWTFGRTMRDHVEDALVYGQQRSSGGY